MNLFIYACRGYDSDYNLYKFNSNFELENVVNDGQFKINNCVAVVITLIQSPSDENKLNLIESCNEQGASSNDLPDSFYHDNVTLPQPPPPNPTSPLTSTSTISSSATTFTSITSWPPTSLVNETEKKYIYIFIIK